MDAPGTVDALAKQGACPVCSSRAREGSWCGVCGTELAEPTAVPRFSAAAEERRELFARDPEAARDAYRERTGLDPATGLEAPAEEPAAPGAPAAAPEVKTCPECAEEIKAAAVVCRFCGFRFDGRRTAPTAPAPAPAPTLRLSNPFTTADSARGGPVTHTLAVIAFFCSAFGFWIAGLPLGYIARREIIQSRGRLTGEGWAYAAIVIGWIMLVISALVLLFVLDGLSQFGEQDEFTTFPGEPEFVE